MRISSALFLLLPLLAGCDRRAPDASAIPGGNAEEGRIACALAGSTSFERRCGVDRTRTDEGVILTLHQPDGGFHRLRIVDDGRGLVAADGAEPIRVKVAGKDGIEVTAGGTRFRLPARVGPLPTR